MKECDKAEAIRCKNCGSTLKNCFFLGMPLCMIGSSVERVDGGFRILCPAMMRDMEGKNGKMCKK